MKKRLRKKQHIKEFAEYGIQVDFSADMPEGFEASMKGFNGWLDSFLVDFVDAEGLICGGGFEYASKENKNKGSFVLELIGKWAGDYHTVQKAVSDWFYSHSKRECEITFKWIDLWYPDRSISNDEKNAVTRKVRDRKS